MQENDTRKQISPAFSSTPAKHRHMILPHACFYHITFFDFFKPKCLLCNVFGRSHGKRAESARFSGRRLPSGTLLFTAENILWIIFIPPIPGRRYLLCQPSLTGSSMTTEIKTGSMTWENPASPAYLFCYIRLPAAALPPNPTPMAAMAFPSPRQAPIQSAKPRSRPTPARLLWLLNRQAMLTPTTPAHGPPRSLPPKSNATRSLPGKISGMTQWMLPCPAPLK